MGIRYYKPTSPGRRFASVSDFPELTDQDKKPEKGLTAPLKKTSVRNHHGFITCRHRGGGLGKFIPGTSRTYGVLNYTMFAVSRRDYFTIRNEWWRDEQGERTGFPSNYSSHTIGLSHQFSDLVMIRPEIGFYHSYDVPAFDLGKNKNLLMYGFDFTIRF